MSSLSFGGGDGGSCSTGIYFWKALLLLCIACLPEVVAITEWLRLEGALQTIQSQPLLWDGCLPSAQDAHGPIHALYASRDWALCQCNALIRIILLCKVLLLDRHFIKKNVRWGECSHSQCSARWDVIEPFFRLSAHRLQGYSGSVAGWPQHVFCFSLCCTSASSLCALGWGRQESPARWEDSYVFVWLLVQFLSRLVVTVELLK